MFSRVIFYFICVPKAYNTSIRENMPIGNSFRKGYDRRVFGFRCYFVFSLTPERWRKRNKTNTLTSAVPSVHFSPRRNLRFRFVAFERRFYVSALAKRQNSDDAKTRRSEPFATLLPDTLIEKSKKPAVTFLFCWVLVFGTFQYRCRLVL